MPSARLNCTHCGAPLDALARRLHKNHCDRAACRQLADASVLEGRWQALVAIATDRVAARADSPAPAPVQVLWLNPVTRHTEEVGPALRAALAQAWRDAHATGYRREFAGTDSATQVPAEAAALCAHCGGGCCSHGAHHHGFIDAAVLERWLAQHPGRSTDDAIDDYLSHLPATHVAGSCAFHSAQGCSLPREHRADTCNRYICKTLATWGEALTATPGRAALVVTRDGRRWEQLAAVQQGRLEPLHGLPQPDDLPAPRAVP